MAADTLHCSKVRAFLVTSKLIGIEPGGLVFLNSSGSSSPSSLSTQSQGQSQGQGQGQGQTQGQGQGQGQTQGQGQGQGQGQTQGQILGQGQGQSQNMFPISGSSTLKPIVDVNTVDGPVAVRKFHIYCHIAIIQYYSSTMQSFFFFMNRSTSTNKQSEKLSHFTMSQNLISVIFKFLTHFTINLISVLSYLFFIIIFSIQSNPFLFLMVELQDM